jgi:hypothetical protein
MLLVILCAVSANVVSGCLDLWLCFRLGLGPAFCLFGHLFPAACRSLGLGLGVCGFHHHGRRFLTFFCLIGLAVDFLIFSSVVVLDLDFEISLVSWIGSRRC